MVTNLDNGIARGSLAKMAGRVILALLALCCRADCAPGWEHAITYDQPQSAGGDSGVVVPAELISTPRPANDNFNQRIPLPSNSISFSFTGTNLGATAEPGETNFLGDQFGGRSVWYSYRPRQQGLLRITSPPTYRGFSRFGAFLSSGSAVNNLAPVGRSIPISDGSPYGTNDILYADVLPDFEYKLAIDGAFEGATLQGGTFNANLRFVPSPSNDNFTRASNIPGRDFSTSLQFLAASREAGEPSHGGGAGSLWWRWVAPVNGLVTLRATQLGNFVPRVVVYRGSVVSNLTAEPSITQTIGHTRQIRFNSIKGNVYAIAVCGAKFDTNPFPQISDDNFGAGRFELNCSSLAVQITNLITSTNASTQVLFTATSQIQNHGTLSSGPLRLRLIACPGVSKTELNQYPTTHTQVQLETFPLVPSNQVLPGLSGPMPISGVCPAPIEDGTYQKTGWEVFCLLEEQQGTNWFLQDKLLVLQGAWLSIGGGGGGPGSGVIRLESELKGSSYDELLFVEILGPSPIYEGATVGYAGRAHFVVAPSFTFTNTVWSATRYTITNGIFRAGSLTADASVRITARYAFAGQDYSTNRNILVLNLPPPSFVPSGLVSGSLFNLSLRGVPGRRHVVEATTNLSTNVTWLPLATNVLGPLGTWNFTEPINRNLKSRYYRARELD